MSILKKPYEIAVYDEVLENGIFVEKRLGIIGSDKMTSQARAIEPNLVRNVNGQNKFSFKMYKHYIDVTTGEKTNNPFVDWLISERKVKLKYGKHVNDEGVEVDTWYDFVIKDISEPSSNYLYTYQLEDANVQELSKNGFGITLDAALMNNIGDSKELAEYVMSETDWNVTNCDVPVQTVDDALVYIKLPAGQKAWHILDQVDTLKGVTIDREEDLGDQTVLAFYSSCKNKPHRFQFIYSANGYNKNIDGQYSIDRKDDRTISEKDCQYYIDFDTPETTYIAYNSTYDLYLPDGFTISSPAISDKESESDDTVVSTWYRGARYGFAQQSVYVPLLEKYCQKFTKEESVVLSNENKKLHQDGSKGGISQIDEIYTKNSEYSGIKFLLDYNALDTYELKYTINIQGGNLYNIGGHNKSFDTQFWVKVGGENYPDKLEEFDGPIDSDIWNFSEPGEDNSYNSGNIHVFARYIKKIPLPEDVTPYIFIQPNRGRNDEIEFKLDNLSIKKTGDFLGYTDSNFLSPTLIQNYITGYKFETTSGWTASSSEKMASDKKAATENVYGRFIGSGDNAKFVTVVEDFLNGNYSEANSYKPRLKMSFFDDKQFVLNSGIKDNRVIIENMPTNEEWVLDYKIVNSHDELSNDNFSFSLGEYIYDINQGIYVERNGFIKVVEQSEEDIANDCRRLIFKVDSTLYTKESFKKDSKIFLRIKPNTINTTSTTQNGMEVISPDCYYIEKIALYKKHIGADGQIIYPDYEEENSLAAETWSDQGTIQHSYNYFNAWYIDSNNPRACTDKEQLPLMVTTSLDYSIYKPVYNEGAKKVRTVTTKESNCFNILQTIAETFEQWLVINIDRNEDGSIKENGKQISFKNYRGNDNYACFRYGVNLKDVIRTYSSKNIVTKLIVKQNTNELADNGFCTIQRAGSNPTGENYIYDFQYYQNTGVMKAEDYLRTNYYIDGAQGPDGTLWQEKNSQGEIVEGAVKIENDYNLNGYFPRIKKINDAILPINKEIVGLQTDLVKRSAELETAEAMYEAAVNGIEQVTEDFYALTGVYPEQAQSGTITGVGDITAQPQESWFSVGKPVLDQSDDTITIPLELKEKEQNIGAEITPLNESSIKKLTSGVYEFTKNSTYDGLYVHTNWDNPGRRYTLSYELELINGTLNNIGCHNSWFNEGFQFSIKDSTGKPVATGNDDILELPKTVVAGQRYFVTVSGIRTNYSGIPEQSQDLWIQPNRGLTIDGENNKVTCYISNIQLTKTLTSEENITNYERTAHIYLTVSINIDSDDETEITRVYSVSCKVPAEATTAQAVQKITTVDLTRSDIQKYLTEYTTYLEKRESSSAEKEVLTPIIAQKENDIKQKKLYLQRLLEYKKELNKLFFTRYCRFIQEGTWIDEEYVDDEKYYADALSVLYNSCYPQAAYNINVLELSQLPGYELFKFELGDKTWVIDEEFFGEDRPEEIIITELSEKLDDPSQNQIKVQNFKNQFQDLFQKITATVQQTQYNVGSYEKGAALVDASAEAKSSFIVDAINNAKSYLNAGQTVESGPFGITITDDSDKQRQLRLVGGAILFSTTDPETQETSWRTGLTNEGISADLIRTGRLDTNSIQIMSGDSPVFRWDEYGISAYEALWSTVGGIKTISGINSRKFVRFDKYGIYGINSVEGIDGAHWYPGKNGQTAEEDIDNNATFALTWEGLKVTGNNGVVARIGRSGENIISITKSYVDSADEDSDGNVTEIITKSLMTFSNDGTLTVGDWFVTQEGLESGNRVARLSLRAASPVLSPPRIFLSANGRRVATDKSWEANRSIVFKAGDNFYVDQEGSMKSTSGLIGDWTINSTGLFREVDSGYTAVAGNKILYKNIGLIPNGENISGIDNIAIFSGVTSKEQKVTYTKTDSYNAYENYYYSTWDKKPNAMSIEESSITVGNIGLIVLYEDSSEAYLSQRRITPNVETTTSQLTTEYYCRTDVIKVLKTTELSESCFARPSGYYWKKSLVTNNLARTSFYDPYVHIEHISHGGPSWDGKVLYCCDVEDGHYLHIEEKSHDSADKYGQCRLTYRLSTDAVQLSQLCMKLRIIPTNFSEGAVLALRLNNKFRANKLDAKIHLIIKAVYSLNKDYGLWLYKRTETSTIGATDTFIGSLGDFYEDEPSWITLSFEENSDSTEIKAYKEGETLWTKSIPHENEEICNYLQVVATSSFGGTIDVQRVTPGSLVDTYDGCIMATTITHTFLEKYISTSLPTFYVTTDGSMYAKSGKIADWIINDDYLGKGNVGDAGSLLLSASGIKEKAFEANEEKNWVISIGQNFGITTEGVLYCTAAVITGNGSAFGMFKIEEDGSIVYKDASWHGSTEAWLFSETRLNQNGLTSRSASYGDYLSYIDGKGIGIRDINPGIYFPNNVWDSYARLYYDSNRSGTLTLVSYDVGSTYYTLSITPYAITRQKWDEGIVQTEQVISWVTLFSNFAEES